MTTLPDSGQRSEFSTGAVRDAAAGKGYPHMIPPCAIRAMARRFEDGAAKYSRLNYMRGIPLSRFYDAIMRHTMQAGEGDVTEDHHGAILWNAAVWLWTLDQIEAGNLPQELDDLPYRSVATYSAEPINNGPWAKVCGACGLRYFSTSADYAQCPKCGHGRAADVEILQQFHCGVCGALSTGYSCANHHCPEGGTSSKHEEVTGK